MEKDREDSQVQRAIGGVTDAEIEAAIAEFGGDLGDVSSLWDRQVWWLQLRDLSAFMAIKSVAINRFLDELTMAQSPSPGPHRP